MSTTKFINMAKSYLLLTSGHIIIGPIFTACTFKTIDQMYAACSLDYFLSPSWIAAATFLPAAVITIHYRLAQKAYATIHFGDHLVLAFLHDVIVDLLPAVSLLALIYMTYSLVDYLVYSLLDPTNTTCFPVQLTFPTRAFLFFVYAVAAATHWLALASLYRLAIQDAHESEVSEIGGHEIALFQTGQEIVLFQIWTQPAFITFLNTFEFYLPAINAVADLRNLTAVDRDNHDSDVQALRDNIDKYRAFYKNAEKTKALGEDAIKNLNALKRTIALSFTKLKFMKNIYPCTQQSDKDRLDMMFGKIETVFDNRFLVPFYF
ncbi:hypothetical protein BDP27DRAFT_1446975 [Rhodocollybia butyracea]|uniref:Uncharacterized protein n=1 Tax=Rhodocollybia butyracea TaxID=206335 RepID=A0A9P5PWP5_9AGAR|nr:hypothetical protein BDP27DRAFT_1446975 [Rhodocollybia butyracea]